MGYNRDGMAKRLKDIGFEVIEFKPKQGRMKKQHPCKWFDEPIIGVDVGLHLGLAYLSQQGLVMAVKVCPDLEQVIRTLCLLFQMPKRYFNLTAIEGAYCPSYLAVMLCGAAVGLGYNSQREVVVIPPHKKPPDRKMKSQREKVEKFLKWATDYFKVEVEMPTVFSHSVSAFGTIEGLKDAEYYTDA